MIIALNSVVNEACIDKGPLLIKLLYYNYDPYEVLNSKCMLFNLWPFCRLNKCLLIYLIVSPMDNFGYTENIYTFGFYKYSEWNPYNKDKVNDKYVFNKEL